MKKLLVLFLSLFLTGCADHAIDLCCTKDYSVGDEEMVTIFGTWNSIDASSIAEKH